MLTRSLPVIISLCTYVARKTKKNIIVSNALGMISAGVEMSFVSA